MINNPNFIPQTHTLHNIDKKRLATWIFSISMALLMCYGMELYNHLLMGSGLSFSTLLSPFAELVPMSLVVLVVQKLIGERVVERIMQRLSTYEIPASATGLLLGTVTCLVMCPLMSMVATLVFKHPEPTSLVLVWASTVGRNLPVALCWALLVARPLSGVITGRISKRT